MSTITTEPITDITIETEEGKILKFQKGSIAYHYSLMVIKGKIEYNVVVKYLIQYKKFENPFRIKNLEYKANGQKNFLDFKEQPIYITEYTDNHFSFDLVCIEVQPDKKDKIEVLNVYIKYYDNLINYSSDKNKIAYEEIKKVLEKQLKKLS